MYIITHQIVNWFCMPYASVYSVLSIRDIGIESVQPFYRIQLPHIFPPADHVRLPESGWDSRCRYDSFTCGCISLTAGAILRISTISWFSSQMVHTRHNPHKIYHQYIKIDNITDTYNLEILFNFVITYYVIMILQIFLTNILFAS